MYASRFSATQLTALLLSFSTWSLSAGATTARVWRVYLSSKRLNGRAWRMMEALHKAERVPTRRIRLVKLALLHLLHTVHRRLLPAISIRHTDRDSSAAHTKLSTAVRTTCMHMNMCDMHERHYF